MKTKNTNNTIIYLSHGGGPLPILGEKSHTTMINFMKNLPDKINKPKAIIVFSAHWEEEILSITASNAPNLIYDYFGFPNEAYSIKYNASGNSELSTEIKNILNINNIKAELTIKRGLDHGVFIPLKLMYPEADIPVIAISLLKGLDPVKHLQIGTVLKDLKKVDILFIGSGFSFHNMREFSQNSKNIEDSKNNEFQETLIDICTNDLNYEENKNQLANWKKFPNSQYCHPRAEHLIPLHICFGLSDKPGKVIFDDYILGKRSVAFQW